MNVNFKKEVINRLVLPVLQGLFLVIPFYILGHYIGILFSKDPKLTSPLTALLFSTYFIWHEFISKKPWSFPAKMKEKVAKAYSLEMKQSTTIVVTSDSGKRGEYFYIDGWGDQFTKRLGFYLIYLNGKLTHDYLRHEPFKLSRGEVEQLQGILRSERIAEYKNPRDPSRGVILKNKGLILFHQVARLYTPTPFERKMVKKYAKGYNISRATRTQHEGN
jgi:hypothetical protein